MLLLVLACTSAPPKEATPASQPVAAAAPPPAPAPRETGLPAPESVPYKAHGRDNGDYAPEVSGTNLLDGSPFRLSDRLGLAPTMPAKAAIVAFSASWCGPCRQSLPQLKELTEEYGDDLAVVILTTDTKASGRASEVSHVRDAGLPAIVVQATEADQRAWLGERRNIPHLYIINAIGEVLVQDRGYGPKVKKLLPGQVRYANNHPEYVERR